VVKNINSVGVPASEHAGSSRRAVRSGAIKAVESQRGPSHIVKMGRFDKRMPIVAHVPPSLIVGHDQDDVRLLGGKRSQGGQEPHDCGISKSAEHMAGVCRIILVEQALTGLVETSADPNAVEPSVSAASWIAAVFRHESVPFHDRLVHPPNTFRIPAGKIVRFTWIRLEIIQHRPTAIIVAQ